MPVTIDPPVTSERRSAPAPSTDEAVRRLRQLVERSAGRWKRWVILEALAVAVGAPLAFLWLVFLLDNLVHLAVWSRLLADTVFLAAAGYLIASLLRRWRRLQLTEDQVALAMERRTPGGVQNRLINALQISRQTRGEGGGHEFGDAVIEENYQTLQRIVLHQAAQLRPAIVRVGFACVVVVVGILFWSFQREHFKNAATRIMLPLARVDPLYQTVLEVQPGDVEGAGDIPIHVHVRGKIPGELIVVRIADGNRSTETVPLAAGKSDVDYTFRAVNRSTSYAVRGGDFTSAYYRITVPTPSALAAVKVTYQFPAYTHLPAKTAQSAGADLEALVGTKAKVIFVFDHPADSASMLLHKVVLPQTQPAPAGANSADALPANLPLQKLSPTEFAGEITFMDVVGYQLETHQGARPADMSSRYALHVRADQDPNLQLIGLNKQAEASPDAVLPLTIDATDDFGLDRVGLFARKVGDTSSAEAAPTTQPGDEGWKPVQVWPVGGAIQFHQEAQLALAALGAAEGDKFEIALRGADTDPLKKGALTAGPTYTLVVGGEGVAIQLLYEQILRTEAELKSLIAAEEASTAETSAWMQKLNPASGLRWDDKANLDSLAAGVKVMAAGQDGVRQTSGRVAREMVAQAGNLRLSIALLADSEMVRVIRILESTPTQDTVQAKRAAMTDAKMAQERTTHSLREVLDQYVKFRQDWELGNMIPFTKMLADRQGALRDESTKTAALLSGKADAARQNAANRRQAKVAQLCGVSRVAFDGLTERVKGDEPLMSNAFAAASGALAAPDLKGAMDDAAQLAGSGQWGVAAAKQDVAAKALAAIHQQLAAAKVEAAKQALAAIREKAKSDVEAQKELERLRAGSTENALKDIDANQLKLAEIIHMREVAAGRNDAKGEEGKENPYAFDDRNKSALQQADTGRRQKFDHLKLASVPTGLMGAFPNQSDRAGNTVTPHIQQEFEDLVGKLLEEADILKDKYDTYNINLGVNIDEAGNVGKSGGDMNSTAAAAATGNQKQPPHDQGGISREGRQGARAHGMVMGDEGVNRRGRDEVQEGQERTPDQAGSIKQAHSDDEQKDLSTGMGGKKVETDEDTMFNVSDKGKFTEDMAARMGKVASKNVIVERQDGKLDPRIADMLRDLNGTQEQVIERIKAIRKELNSLYLPTDQLDEIAAQLTANLDSLKDRPSADVFRLQAQTLDKLRGAVKVFTQYGSGYQPSLPRDQAVRGRVLDEPARQTIPGYEEAVKNYYETLSTPQIRAAAMNQMLPRIFTLVVPLLLAAPLARGGDVAADPTDLPILANLVPVAAPQARATAVSDVASALAFTNRPQKDKVGELWIFGLDAAGEPVGTPGLAPLFGPAPAAPGAASVPPAPPPPPSLPLFTVQLPRPASLATFMTVGSALLFHPRLPLLYVWQDIDGPPMTSAKDNVVFKDFDHLLVYSLAAGQPPKLELATARGPQFMYGQGATMLAIDPDGRRLMLPNLRALSSADSAAGGAVGYVKLDERGMPVKEGDKLAMTVDDLGAYNSIPAALGCVFASETVCVFGGAYGPTTWDRADRRGKFSSYWTGLNAGTGRLVGHWSLPLVYFAGVNQASVFKMEHADGYITMAPQRLSIANGTGFSTPPVMMPRQNEVALGSAGKVYVAALDAEGNFTPSVTQTAVDNPTVEALAYSEKFDRLYVGVEKRP